MKALLFDGRYRLLKKLGSGSSATVWLAADAQDGERPVAVKIIKDEALRGRYALDRLEREAKILASLAHPNIVAGVISKVGDGVAYIAMEYLQGVSLARKLSEHSKQGEPIELDEIRAIFRQICAAVSAAHQRGVIHRDLKPKNVMVSETAGGLRVKVIDFGVARSVERPPSEATTVGRLIGSYLFMSPEQVAGNVADERSDIFALGCILFELLTLRRAWARDAEGRALSVHASLLDHPKNALGDIFERITRGERPKPSDVDPRAGSEADALIARALARDPAARPGSVSELEAGLEAITFAKSSSSGERTVRDAPPRSNRVEESAVAFARLPGAGHAPEPAPTIARNEVAAAELLALDRPSDRPFDRPPDSKLFRVTLVLLFAVMMLAVATLSTRRTPSRAPDLPPAIAGDVGERARERGSPKAELAAAPAGEGAERVVHREALQPAPAKRSRSIRDAAPARKAPPLRELERLAAELEEVRTGGRPAGELAAIGREIIDRSASVEDLELQQRIKKRAYASSLTADVEGMKECLELLRNHR